MAHDPGVSERTSTIGTTFTDIPFGSTARMRDRSSDSRGLVRVLKISVAFAIALYLLSLTIFFFTQRSLLYFPNHSYIPLTEAQANPAFQEFAVRTSDGLDLRAWYARATGNAESAHICKGCKGILRLSVDVRCGPISRSNEPPPRRRWRRLPMRCGAG